MAEETAVFLCAKRLPPSRNEMQRERERETEGAAEEEIITIYHNAPYCHYWYWNCHSLILVCLLHVKRMVWCGTVLYVGLCKRLLKIHRTCFNEDQQGTLWMHTSGLPILMGC